jgi:ribosomal protein S8
MFLHIGADVVVPVKNIIAIFDIDNTTISKDTREFLKVAEEEGFIESISTDLPKSFIITEVDKKSKIYLSPISSTTLQKRSSYIKGISNVKGIKR